MIAGERRLRAAKEAGIERVPVLIRQADEDETMELALVENLQREQLNPLETAAAYQALMDSFGLTREQLAARLGKSRTSVTNTLRLVQLPESVRVMLQEGSISEGHARAVLGLKDEVEILRLAKEIQQEKLSVRRVEEMVREINAAAWAAASSEPGADTPPPDSPNKKQREADRNSEALDRISNKITQAIKLQTRIKKSRRGGKIEIRFKHDEELETIIAKLIEDKTR